MNGLALIKACKNGFMDVVELLLSSSGGFLDVKESIRSAVEKNHGDILLRIFKYSKSLPDAAEFDYLLKLASKKGFVKIVKILVDNGANVNGGGFMAVNWAMLKGHDELVYWFFSNGADPEIGLWNVRQPSQSSNLRKWMPFLVDILTSKMLVDELNREIGTGVFLSQKAKVNSPVDLVQTSIKIDKVVDLCEVGLDASASNGKSDRRERL